MKLTLTTVLFSVFLSTAMSSSFRILNTKFVVDSPKFNCTGLPTKCECPYPCLEQVKNENYCIAKKCYKFDNDLGQCKKAGHDHVAPLVLQAIPFTAVFGSGFGNIGRWDLFGMYMGILFGGCCLILMGSACCLCCCSAKESDDEYSLMNDKEGCMKSATTCGGCIWAIVILIFYILGIVWTSTEGGVLDANGCPLIF
tara:strand:- start:33 stop:626 length:594 start_codon:yes stop_codon:yes gene_type:complete